LLLHACDEHPTEAFNYFRTNGVERVVCQEKHMGSRAVVVICRDEATALKRFGISNDGSGIIYTRTGRRFFDDRSIEEQLLAIPSANAGSEEFWPGRALKPVKRPGDARYEFLKRKHG